MKREHLILLLGAAVVAYLVLRQGKKESSVEVIKPGDKGKDVFALQETLTSLTGLKFSDMGAYDNSTLDMVRYYMSGTSALVDPEKGYVSKDFANDLYIIQNKAKKQ